MAASTPVEFIDSTGERVGNRIQIDLVVAPTTLYHSKVTVTNAGTRVQLTATATPIVGVTVRAHSGQAGYIYLGGPTVDANNGFQLAAGEAQFVEINDLSKLWIDASAGNHSISYIASV